MTLFIRLKNFINQNFTTTIFILCNFKTLKKIIKLLIFIVEIEIFTLESEKGFFCGEKLQ